MKVWILLLAGIVPSGQPTYKVFNDTTTLTNYIENNSLNKPQVYIGQKIDFGFNNICVHEILKIECDALSHNLLGCLRKKGHTGKHTYHDVCSTLSDEKIESECSVKW